MVSDLGGSRSGLLKERLQFILRPKKRGVGAFNVHIFNKSGLTPNTERITFTFINITGGPCSTCLFKSLVNQTVIRGL